MEKRGLTGKDDLSNLTKSTLDKPSKKSAKPATLPDTNYTAYRPEAPGQRLGVGESRGESTLTKESKPDQGFVRNKLSRRA